MSRRRCVILQFPIERARKPAPPPPKTVKLHHDFGEWCAVGYVGGQRERGWFFSSLAEARATIRQLVEDEGYEQLPPSEAAIAAGAESLGGAA